MFPGDNTQKGKNSTENEEVTSSQTWPTEDLVGNILEERGYTADGSLAPNYEHKSHVRPSVNERESWGGRISSESVRGEQAKDTSPTPTTQMHVSDSHIVAFLTYNYRDTVAIRLLMKRLSTLKEN